MKWNRYNQDYSDYEVPINDTYKITLGDYERGLSDVISHLPGCVDVELVKSAFFLANRDYISGELYDQLVLRGLIKDIYDDEDINELIITYVYLVIVCYLILKRKIIK